MKRANSNKIRLGIFVTLGTALLIIGIYFIGERHQLFSSTFRVSAVFKDISGLQIGNNVRLAGINIGVIEDIEMIADTAVRVDVIINEDARKFIRKDSRATIGSEGLMGNKVLVILPGSPGAENIKDRDFLEANLPVSIDDLMANFQVTSSNMAYITDDLSVITYNLSSGRGTIGRLLMDTVMAEEFEKTLINIKQGAGGLKRNMDAASRSFLLRGGIRRMEREKEKAAEEKKKEQEKKAKEEEKKAKEEEKKDKDAKKKD
ncbi:MAG TPA: MlaD family protein [Bacteroidales bacterium]|nr:MlaD family protein [Bacteroidales bacterium]